MTGQRQVVGESIRPPRRPGNEHNWHDCTTPDPAAHIHNWTCPICHQHWIWRRPPRPAAGWIRATPEDH